MLNTVPAGSLSFIMPVIAFSAVRTEAPLPTGVPSMPVVPGAADGVLPVPGVSDVSDVSDGVSGVKRGITTVSTNPQAEHSRSFLPSLLTEGSVTTAQSPHLCPVALIITADFGSSLGSLSLSKNLPQTAQLQYSILPAVSHPGSFASTLES